MTSKYKDVVTEVNGVKYTMCAPRMPRKHQRTFDVDRSRYTPWTQGVRNYSNGTRGVLGTVENIVR